MELVRERRRQERRRQQRTHTVLELGYSDDSGRSASAEPETSVVIPALNEARNLPLVLPRIPRWVHQVILVDGSSSDGTDQVARALFPGIQIINEPKPGKGAALCAGFSQATGDIIVTLDADASTDPAEIPLFVASLKAGADFVKGSRFLQGGGTSDMPWYRRLGNRGFVALVRMLFGGNFTDLLYGYNAFWRNVLPLLDLKATGFEIETLMNIRALKAGLRIAEVPSYEYRRSHGEGRLKTFPDGWRVLMTVLMEAANGRRTDDAAMRSARPKLIEAADRDYRSRRAFQHLAGGRQ